MYICDNKILLMEAANNIEEKIKESTKSVGSSNSYPVASLEVSINNVQKIVSSYGTSSTVSKIQIGDVLKKSTGSLGLHCSTWVQYGLVDLVFGKGYQISNLFKKFLEPVYDADSRKTQLEMFCNPPLYSKIIENLDGQILPPEDKFPNLLKSDPYNIHPSSAERASKIFFENAKYLKLLDANNKFRFKVNNSTQNINETVHNIDIPYKAIKPKEIDSDLFELPIPLGGKRRAYLKYPLEDLSKKDIRVIRKALEFIESSILDEYDNIEKERVE